MGKKRMIIDMHMGNGCASQIGTLPMLRVAPILQGRRLFHRNDEGAGLPNHFDAPARYGLDPRLNR